MNAVEKLQTDRERHAKALVAAASHTALLREQLERAHILDDVKEQDAFVGEVLRRPTFDDGAGMSLAPADTARAGPSATLLEVIKHHRTMEAEAKKLSLQKERQALAVMAAELDKLEERIASKRNPAQRLNLVEAIADDERLAGMAPRDVLREFQGRQDIAAAAAAQQQQQQQLQAQYGGYGYDDGYQPAAAAAARPMAGGGGGGMRRSGKVSMLAAAAPGIAPSAQHLLQHMTSPDAITAAALSSGASPRSPGPARRSTTTNAAAAAAASRPGGRSAGSSAPAAAAVGPSGRRQGGGGKDDEGDGDDNDSDDDMDGEEGDAAGPRRRGDDEASENEYDTDDEAVQGAYNDDDDDDDGGDGSSSGYDDDGGDEYGQRRGADGALASPSGRRGRRSLGALLAKARSRRMRRLRRAGSGGGPVAVSGVQLEELGAALQEHVAEAEFSLKKIRARHAVLAARLAWTQQGGSGVATGGRSTAPGADLMTAKQLRLRSMCDELIDEMLVSALRHVAMRPSRAQVHTEVAGWVHSRQGALVAIGRQVADGVLRELVDEMIAEVHGESSSLGGLAESWAFDLLVEAVAFSQGKLGGGGGEGGGGGGRGGRGGGGGEKGSGRAAVAQAPPPAAASGGAGGAGGSAGPPSRVVRHGVSSDLSGLAPLDVYGVTRLFDDDTAVEMGRDSRQALYMYGLKAMMAQMRSQRGPDTPYGHTQQLTPYFAPGTRVTKAAKLAAGRARPPLAAGPSVWKASQAHVRRLGAAPFPRVDHIAAARTLEAAFWAQVDFLPSFIIGARSVAAATAPLSPGSSAPPPRLTVSSDTGHITCLSACPAGTFVAAGTSNGCLTVWDIRGPGVAYFQVSGDSATRRRERGSPVCAPLKALAWSSDSYQLAALDAEGCLRLWWMRPASGQPDWEPGSRPVVPALAASITPLHMSISGKAPIQDLLADGDAAAASASASAAGGGGGSSKSSSVNRSADRFSWSLAFHPAATLTGTQPSLVLPQPTGDVLHLASACSGPGTRLLPNPLPRSQMLAPSSRGSAAGPPLHPATVNFLLPPLLPSREVLGQALYRGHDAHVTFIGFLADGASLVTVDVRGVVHTWPVKEGDRSGFGWFEPRRVWAMPRGLRTFHPRGAPDVVWPKPRAGRGAPATTAARGGGKVGGGVGGGRSAYDALDGDDENEALGLSQDPTGDFLLARRVLWLVRYRTDVSTGTIVLDEIHRPVTAGQALVISSYVDEPAPLPPRGGRPSPPTRRLLQRSKQYAAYTKMSYTVVAARLTPSRRDLLLVSHVAAQADDPDSFSFFSVHVVNIEAGKPLTPRIDIYDHSRGVGPPALDVSPTVSSLGSEYLLAGLGSGMVGVYSVATGQLVRVADTGLGWGAPYFSCLTLAVVSSRQGRCANSDKTYVLVVAAHSTQVHALRLDDSAGVQEAIAAQERAMPAAVLAKTGRAQALAAAAAAALAASQQSVTRKPPAKGLLQRFFRSRRKAAAAAAAAAPSSRLVSGPVARSSTYLTPGTGAAAAMMRYSQAGAMMPDGARLMRPQQPAMSSRGAGAPAGYARQSRTVMFADEVNGGPPGGG